MKLKLFFTLFITSALTFAQVVIPDAVKPPSWSLSNLNNIKPFKLPSFDLKKLQEEDKINDKNKSIPWRFGHDIYVDHDFNDVGEWTTLDNGDKIWRMSYKSKNAYTINFLFDVFKIPEGAKLYVYNNEKTDLLRPFTHHNNNPEEVLGTWLVEGDHAWIEYYQPANVVGEARITVGSVVHGYRTAESYQKGLNTSGACNQDVDCDITPISDPHQLNTRKEEIKAASAMIVVNGTGNCSGTLVNNTNNDGKAYFMTANHCGGGEASWAFRFNWRSPSPSCSTTALSPNGSYNQTVSGAILRANSSQSDMELVEITDASFFNTNSANLVWAGWNRSTTQVPAVNFGIHHPDGDIQKVCRDDDGAYRAVVPFGGNPNTQMWYIDQWELGVTEPGSSGSGLFNENGHLIGMLSGGQAACNGTSNNGLHDYYGRFGVAWDYGSSQSSRLKEWLDPSNSNIVVLDQYPSLQTYNVDATVNAGSGNSPEICDENFEPQVTLLNSGVLNLTSADVTYYIDSEAPSTVSWTGNLSNGGSAVIATPTYTNLSPGNHSFTINVTNPNATTDENTSNDSFIFNFTVSPAYTTSNIVFDILTDDYGEETTWELKNSNDVVVASGPTNPYSNNTNYQEIIPITTYGCYTFTIIDEEEDGICCQYGNGSYSLGDGNNNTIISGGSFTTSESITFRVQDPLSVDKFDLSNLIGFYPNPVNDVLNVVLTRVSEDVDYQVFNTLGQKIEEGNLLPHTSHQINMSQYKTGIYFISFKANNSEFTRKIVKR